MNSSQQSEAVQTKDKDPGVVSTLSKITINFAKRNKAVTGTYVIGLLLLMFATGFTVSDQSRQTYEDAMQGLDVSRISQAERRVSDASSRYYASQGIFTCDATCQHWKRLKSQAEAELYQARTEYERGMTQARKEAGIGIFSEYGVQETRDQFWGAFSWGQGVAKRQSMWDLVFSGLRWGKDEELFTVILRWLVQLLFNFTIGMVMALIYFVYKLFSVISAYEPDPISAVLYFVLAAVSAMACIGTYLVFIYGAAAGSVGYAAKAIIDHNRRISQDPRYQARRVQHTPGYGYGGERRQHFD